MPTSSELLTAIPLDEQNEVTQTDLRLQEYGILPQSEIDQPQTKLQRFISHLIGFFELRLNPVTRIYPTTLEGANYRRRFSQSALPFLSYESIFSRHNRVVPQAVVNPLPQTQSLLNQLTENQMKRVALHNVLRQDMTEDRMLQILGDHDDAAYRMNILLNNHLLLQYYTQIQHVSGKQVLKSTRFNFDILMLEPESSAAEELVEELQDGSQTFRMY